MPLPDTMRCVAIPAPGGPEALVPETRPVPVPGAHEVLIAIDHAGVNRPDALQRAGAYDPPPGASDLPGLEAAGTVAAVGAAVTRWDVGDRVCALLPGGGYAEYATCPADHALPIPRGLSMAEAAAVPETHFTVWSNLFDRGRLQAGERFLVHGGTSGIGTTAIQLARARGARVWATAGSDAKVAVCERLGATGVNYREADFVAVARAAGGMDVILDMVGGDYVPRNLKALAEDGRLVQIAFLGGPTATVNFAPLMVRRLTITGSTLRPRSVTEKAQLADALQAEVWPLLEAGTVAPVMDETFALEDAARAHARMEAGDHVGKIVLKVR